MEARDAKFSPTRPRRSANRSTTLGDRRDLRYPPKSFSEGKIFNDQSLRTRSTLLYHVSPSGREGDDQENRSCRAASRDTSRSQMSSGVGETRGEHERRERGAYAGRSNEGHSGEVREEVIGSGSKSAKIRLAEQLESSMTPFLMWRVTQSGASPDTEQEDKEGNLTPLVRLLYEVHKTLSDNDTYKGLDLRDCECSLDDILSRYETLGSTVSEPLPDLTPLKKNASAAADDESTEVVAFDKRGEADFNAMASEMDAEDERGQGPRAEAEPLHREQSFEQNSFCKTMEEVNGLVTIIFARSKSIMSLFIPLDRDKLVNLKSVVVHRYWGSLDLIFRVSLTKRPEHPHSANHALKFKC